MEIWMKAFKAVSEKTQKLEAQKRFIKSQRNNFDCRKQTAGLVKVLILKLNIKQN